MANPLLLVLKGLHRTQSLILRSPSKEDDDGDDKEEILQSSVDNVDGEVLAGEGTTTLVNGTHQANKDDSRRLRSLDGSIAQKESALFSFDLTQETLDNQAECQLVAEQTSLQELRDIFQKKGGVAKLEEPNMETYDYSSYGTGQNKQQRDPLTDEIYIPYHRRMERTEKRVQNVEKDQSALDLDHLSNLVKLLNEETCWRKHIMKLVLISDEDTDEDLQKKRELALGELQGYFAKYHRWKSKMALQRQKEARMRQKIKSKMINSEERQRKKEAKRELKRKAQAEEEARQQQKKQKIEKQIAKESQFVSFYRRDGGDKYRVHPKFDQLIKRNHRNVEAFGQPFPLMIKRDFFIPISWVEQFRPDST